MKINWIFLSFLFFWILVSCAPIPVSIISSESLAPPIRATSPPATISITLIPMTDIALQKLINRAKDDLSARLNTELAEIALLRAEAVNWTDGSLGCPMPEMMYAQMITPGYLILLESNGVTFEYHASQRADAFYCKNPLPPASGIPTDQ